MKNIIPLISIILFASCANNDFNSNFVSICKIEDSIRVDYMDSKVILKSERITKGDTLELAFKIGYASTRKEYKIKLDDGVLFIKYGDTIKSIGQLDVCPKVYSGENAIKHLGEMR